MEDNKVYMTRQEAADVLGVSVRTIDRYATTYLITKYKLRGRTMFDAAEVNALNVVAKVLS